MRASKILDLIFRNSVEGMYFLIIIIIVFNMLTDFFFKIGFVTESLAIRDIQYYGGLSVMFAINNLISKKFFGVELFK